MALIEIGVLAVSVLVLAKSSSVVVENIVKLSKFFHLSHVSIGFLLIAIATTLPELSVSVASSAMGEGAIAAGNVFGSTIANILVVLGAGAFLYGMRINRALLKEVGAVLLLTSLISVYILLNSSVQQNVLGFWEGIVLLAMFAGYIVYILRKKRLDDGNNGIPVTKQEALHAFLLFGTAIVIVIASSGFVVSSAVSIAMSFGISESFIGSTIIALGTSLPELSIALQSIKKKQYGIALGDAIGANMSNLTMVLGTAAAINPIEVRLPIFMATLLFAVIANMLLMYVAAVNRRLERLGGALFLAMYVVYLVVIFYLQLQELGG